MADDAPAAKRPKSAPSEETYPHQRIDRGGRAHFSGVQEGPGHK